MPWIEGDGLTPSNLNSKIPTWFGGGQVFDVTFYGAEGDGTTDDATAIQAAFSAVPTGGGTVIFPNAGTYLSSAALTLQAGTTVDLNGSTLRFTTTADANNLLLRSGCVVENGTVENAGSGWTGHGGNGCPLTIGDYNSGTGYTNVVLRNLTVITAKPGGNAIIVTGDSSNILIENIKADTSATMGRVVLVHWGNADNPTAGTAHPHDIVIRNIDCGDLTYNDVDVSPVLLSGCYNVTVENVEGGDITNGRAMLVYPGDYGAQYASAAVQRAFMRGILVRNYAIASSFIGIKATTKNISGTVSIHAGDMVFEGVAVKSNASTTATSLGVDLTNSDGVHFRDCSFDGFNKNIAFEATVANASFEHCTIANAYANGLNTGTTSTPNFMDVVLAYNQFQDNNQQTTASRGDVTLNNAGRWDIIGNHFDSTYNAFGIRALSTSSRLRLMNNHVSALTAGGTAYSLGAGSDAAFAAGANNTAATGITVHGGSHMPWGVNTMGSTDGTAIVPAYAYSSETSLGFFRSAASHIQQSYGTFGASTITTNVLRVTSGATIASGNLVLSDGSVVMSQGKIVITSEQNAARPEYTFGADVDTGVFQPATDAVGVATGGGERMRIATSNISMSGVTLDLSRAKLSLATTGTSLNSTNIGVEEIRLFIGGGSGATLAVRSGGTIYYFSSSLSTVG